MRFPRQIYAIKHNVTKRIYIGSTSRSLEDRYKDHILQLRKNKHSVKLMQDDFNKYGEDYSVYSLGTIESSEERDKEYQFQLKYNTGDPKFGYNQWDYFIHQRKSKNTVIMTLKDSLDDLDEH